jgi:pyridoxal phosphate enzyme (YggS family)
LRDLAENRIQETSAKRPILESLLRKAGVDPAGIKWHLIGHLQSNKVEKAVELFDVIHSIDTIRLASLLGKAAEDQGRRLRCYVQVNTTGESSKSGVNPEEAEEVAESVFGEKSLRLTGFMTIGPTFGGSDDARASFAVLRNLRDRMETAHPEWGRLGLSMGMSGDFELAIEEGATIVRIGTALFGDRIYPAPEAVLNREAR